MTSLDRITPALRSPLLPLALLLLGLSTVFVFGGDRGYFYRPVGDHSWLSALHLTIAVNISPEHGLQRFERRLMDDDGVTRYIPYNRFPPGGHASMKLATLRFGGNPSAQLYTARILLLLFFSAATILAYLSLCRLTYNRWIALTAGLLSFSSYYLLYYNDMTIGEGIPDLFGVMLTFHGMVVFVQEGRFRQLLLKTCIALLLGWHVLALLLPFVIIGLARDLLRARSAAAVMSIRRIASTLLRSRYLLLGITALAFGLSVLAFNFTMEYIALNGETPPTELPSFQSMLRRIGADSENNVHVAAVQPWSSFLAEQFRSIGRMFVPYPLLGPLVYRADVVGSALVQSPAWLSEFQGVVLGVILSTACLIGSMFARPRILFVTLASSGFVWALPMRNLTAFHDFERIYYIGLPLAFFTLVLLLARRLTNRDGVIGAASVIALLLFAVSSFQMSRVGHSAETGQSVREAEQELLAIRETTAGKLVTVLPLGNIHQSFFGLDETLAMNYYLNTSLIRYKYLPAVDGGFVLLRSRVDTDALLTPQNQHLFLYDRAGFEAWYRAMYRSVVSTEPAARSEFDLYIDKGKMYYLKEPCERADAAGRLFLHVHSFDDDLPDQRKRHGFENFDFEFVQRGLLFNGKCLASVDLPQYDIVKINTGRAGGDAWSATHVVQGPKLDSAYRSIVSREPAARSEFDVYIDDGKLHYVKEPCGEEDTTDRFFLHVVPDDIDDLPAARRQHGFDNLDFAFVERGLLFGGKCLVSIVLPQYAIARITTGQFDGDGRIWGVEFAPDARE